MPHAPARRAGARFSTPHAMTLDAPGARCETLQITTLLPRPTCVCQAMFRRDGHFFAAIKGASLAPVQSLPISPSHALPPILMAAARLSMRLRPPPRLLRPPAPHSRIFVCMCAQASICARGWPEEDPPHCFKGPPPLRAGGLCIAPAPDSSPPLSRHSHPHSHPSLPPQPPLSSALCASHHPPPPPRHNALARATAQWLFMLWLVVYVHC